MLQTAEVMHTAQNTDFLDVERLIASRAWSFARTTGMDPDDLKAQGHLIYLEALQDFDPTRGSFSTWLFTRLNQDLSEYIRREWDSEGRDGSDMMTSEHSNWTASGEDNLHLSGAVDDMSEEAKEVVRMIIQAPRELLAALQINGDPGPKKMRGALRRYLHDGLGWSWPTVWDVMKELRETISNL